MFSDLSYIHRKKAPLRFDFLVKKLILSGKLKKLMRLILTEKKHFT